MNASLPPRSASRKFILLYKELDADDGELTRTRKVRRSVIAREIRQYHRRDLFRPSAIDIDTVSIRTAPSSSRTPRHASAPATEPLATVDRSTVRARRQLPSQPISDEAMHRSRARCDGVNLTVRMP